MHRLASLSLVLASCCAALPAWAQQPTPSSAKPAAIPAAKSAKPAPVPATSREELQSEAKGLALAIQTTEAISEAQMEIASRVLTGRADCEYSQTVEVTPVNEKRGLFVVRFKGASYFMVPTETTTGAVKLTDAKAGVMWLQIPAQARPAASPGSRRPISAAVAPRSPLPGVNRLKPSSTFVFPAPLTPNSTSGWPVRLRDAPA